LLVSRPLPQWLAPHATSGPTWPAHWVVSLPSQIDDLHGSLGSVAQVGRPAWGAPTTGAHCPTNPATSHAAHGLPHDDSQHTPSTQKPLPQSLADAHRLP
jgi:hypothetical protein